MNPDRETDKTDLQALIGLWQREDMRLRSIIRDTETASSVRDQASQRLGSVVEQIRAFTDELDTLDQTDQRLDARESAGILGN
jgi:hypothetical protein